MGQGIMGQGMRGASRAAASGPSTLCRVLQVESLFPPCIIQQPHWQSRLASKTLPHIVDVVDGVD